MKDGRNAVYESVPQVTQDKQILLRGVWGSWNEKTKTIAEGHQCKNRVRDME